MARALCCKTNRCTLILVLCSFIVSLSLVQYSFVYVKFQSGSSETQEQTSEKGTDVPVKPAISAIPNDGRAATEIPRILHFVDTRSNILEDKQPRLFYDNILNTIRIYEQAWNETARVRFLVNQDCEHYIHMAAPKLLPFYRNKRGSDLSDMCRAAVLYETGGYYFDNDMRTLQAWTVPQNCTFSMGYHSSLDGTPAFQNSFSAATPNHAVYRQALDSMVDFYSGRLHGEYRKRKWALGSSLGPYIFKYAHDLLNYSSIEPPKKCMLEETTLDIRKDLYRNLTRQKGQGCCCNYIFHHVNTQGVYFFTRIPGAGPHCQLPSN